MNLNFSQILRDLRQENNLTQSELSVKLGYTQSNISEWEKGTVEPKANALIALAEFFSVSVDYLLGLDGEFGMARSDSAHGRELSAEERKLIDDFRELSQQGKQLVKVTISTFLNNSESESKSNKRKI